MNQQNNNRHRNNTVTISSILANIAIICGIIIGIKQITAVEKQMENDAKTAKATFTINSTDKFKDKEFREAIKKLYDLNKKETQIQELGLLEEELRIVFSTYVDLAIKTSHNLLDVCLLSKIIPPDIIPYLIQILKNFAIQYPLEQNQKALNLIPTLDKFNNELIKVKCNY